MKVTFPNNVRLRVEIEGKRFENEEVAADKTPFFLILCPGKRELLHVLYIGSKACSLIGQNITVVPSVCT